MRFERAAQAIALSHPNIPRRCTSWESWRAGAVTSSRLNRAGEAVAMRRGFLGEQHYLTARSLAAPQPTFCGKTPSRT